jgi:hypothetical protein
MGIGGANTATDDADGVQGFASGAFSGVSGFGGSTSGTGVFGLGGGPGGPGVRGFGAGATPTLPSNNPVGVLGQAGPNADGVQGFATGTFSGVSGFGGSDSGTGVLGFGGGTDGIGVSGIGGGIPNSTPGVDVPVGVYGQGGPNGFGVFGEGNVGVFASGSDVGVEAKAPLGGTALRASNFAGTPGAAAEFHGSVTVEGNFTVISPGMKSAVVPFPDGSHRQLYCLESPESWFEDFGFGRLTDGRARIELDPDFAATVNTDAYHVFITEYDDNNGLFVTNRTNTGFEMRAKTSTSRAEFSYRVVARRKDVAPARLAKVTLPAENKK